MEKVLVPSREAWKNGGQAVSSNSDQGVRLHLREHHSQKAYDGFFKNMFTLDLLGKGGNPLLVSTR